MQAYMSAVHGVMDLEVGCTWRNYGDIYYLTEEQQSAPSVVQALRKRWLIPVSDAEVRYASMDTRKFVGPKPPVQSKSPGKSVVRPMADTSLDIIKRDISQLNADIQSLAGSVHAIVDLLSKGIPVQAGSSESSQVAPQMASISDAVAEELFIPTFKVQDSVSLKTEAEIVSDTNADKALEGLKKLRKKKDTTNG